MSESRPVSCDSKASSPHAATSSREESHPECSDVITCSPKRPRHNEDNDDVPRITDEELPSADNAVVRVILRSFTYFVYDGVSLTGGRKEVARIGKVLVELFVDERFPPPHRADMTLKRKCAEFLAAPAASSFVWYIVRKVEAFHRRRIAGRPDRPNSHVFGKALWTVLHRVARQALIYRLFFRIGSVRYSLASALGIVCCFFREGLFRDLLRFRKWPHHFSASQGLGAILRSIIYAASFALPLHRLSHSLQEYPRRRGNVKKLVFAMLLSQGHRIAQLQKLLASSGAWTL